MPPELPGQRGEGLRAPVVSFGEPSYRGAQLYHAIYAERRFDFVEMPTLPAALRARLTAETRVGLPRILKRYRSADGSVRYLLALEDGSAPATKIETVFMPEANRQTLCLSTQAGCPVKCRLSLTSQLRLVPNLTPA